jgi:hypothetical protein
VPHRDDHQQAHHDQRRPVGEAELLQRLDERHEEQAGQEQQGGHHRGEAGARALPDPGGRLDVGAAGGGAEQRAEHAGQRVHRHRPLDLRQVAVLVQQVAGGAHPDQGAQGVEEAHQEQGEQHR